MRAPQQIKTASNQSSLLQKKDEQQQANFAPQTDPLMRHTSRMGNAPNPEAHAALLNRAPTNQQSSSQNLILQLQRQYGNGYVNQVLQIAQDNKEETSITSMEKPGIQTKLAIGKAGDKYEQEADRTAHHVIQRMSEPEAESTKEQIPEVEEETDSVHIQQKCGACESEEKIQKQPGVGAVEQEEISEDSENEELMVQRKADGTRMEATPNLDSSIQRQRGKGQSLPGKLRQQMEQGFGRDFSGVKVHSGAESNRLTRSIKARAFTIGQDIFFRQGEYSPSSKQGQELLAHELTHVVQQGGNGDKSREDAGVKVSQVSEDTKLQRACAQCEREEEAEGIIQAKKEPSAGDKTAASLEECQGSPSAELSGKASGAGDKEEASEGCGGNTSQKETTESDAGDCQPKNNTDEGQGEDERNQQKQPCPSEREESPPSESSQNTGSGGRFTGIQDALGRERNPEAKETQETTEETKEVSQDRSKLDESAKCDRPSQNSSFFGFLASVSFPSQLIAKTEESKDTAKAEKEQVSPILPQALTSEINLQGATAKAKPTDSKAANPQEYFSANQAPSPGTEQVQPETNVPETLAQPQVTDAKLARLAGAKIAFKLPEQRETSTKDAALEAQRVTSSSMASNFFSEATARVQTVTGLRENISSRISKASLSAKNAVLSTVQQQKDTIAAEINQQRTEVQNQAQATLADIQNQHQASLTNISQQTQTTRQQIQTEYNNTFEKLDEQKSKLFTDIDGLYKDTYDQYIATGEKVGEEAINIGEKYAQQWESEKQDLKEEPQYQGGFGGPTPTPAKGEKDDLDTKAKTARDVAKEYQKQVKNGATEQANKLGDSKPQAVEGICCAINKIYEKLENNQKDTLNCLTQLEQDTTSEVTNVQTELTESVNETLQTTLESLDQQETAHLQMLQGYGDRQIGVIEEDAQKAIASLEKGVNQAATELLTVLQSYYEQFQDMEAPHPDDLSVALAAILTEIDSSVAAVEGETEKAIAASTQGIQQGEQQVIGAVNAIAQSAIEEIGIVAQEASNTFTNLQQGSVEAFKRLKDAYTEQAHKFVETTTIGLAETTASIGQSLNCIYTNLETSLQESVPQLEESLWGILDCLRTDIENYAKQAVGEDQEWWQKLLKALVLVAVLLIGIVVAPFLAGLGPIAAIVLGVALGAALGALAQIANNAIDGKDLMKDVGKAVIMGAIGGAIGGVGGALAGRLAQARVLGAGLTKSFAQYGIETSLDALGEVFGNLAVGDPITAEGILMGVAIGTSVHVSTTKLHGINKRAELANAANKRPDLVNQLPNMKPAQINALAKETGMNPGELHQLAKLKPEELKKYVNDAKQRTGQQDDVTLKLAQAFENMQKRGYQFGQKVGSKVTQPIKNTFGRKQQSDRSDADISREMRSDSDVPTTPRERDILANTAPKRGDQLTSEELKTELDVAGKTKPELINNGEFIEQRELPNNHEWKEKEDGTWCRFSGQGDCMPGVEPNDTNQNATSRKRKRENSQNFQIDELQLSNANPNQTVVKNNIFDLYSELDRLKFDTFKEFLQHLTNISKSHNRLDDLRKWIEEHEFTDIDFQEAINSTKLRRSERNTQSSEQSKSEVFIQYLKHELALDGRESSEDFAANLVYVLGGQKPSPRQGSFGDLEVKVTNTNITISGRPSFAKYTQEIKEVKPGQHRRHIIAWHTMREAMQKYLNQTDAANRDSQLNKLWNDSAIEKEIKNEAIEITKGKTPELQSINDLDVFQKLSLENKVKALLFIMNSNSNNLWVGKGYVNTAINTAFHKINNDVNKLNNSNDLKDFIKKYETAEQNLGKGDRNTKQKKVIDEIEGMVGKFIKAKTKDNPEIKMKNLQKEVKEFLLNFEVDLLGSDAQFTDKDWVSQFDTKIKYVEVGIAINRILSGIDNNSLENQLRFLLKIDN